MAKIEGRPKVTMTVSIALTEEEACALDALAGYGVDEFLRIFYEKMGRAYLQPHEAGLRSLFGQQYTRRTSSSVRCWIRDRAAALILTRAENDKICNRRIKLSLVAVLIVTLWAVVLDIYLQNKLFPSQNFPSSSFIHSPEESAYLAGEYCVRKVRDFLLLEDFSVIKPSGRILGGVINPKCDSRIYGNQENRESGPEKLLPLIGAVVSIIGFIFLFKIIGKVYSDIVLNEYLAVCGACASFTLTVFGLFLVIRYF